MAHKQKPKHFDHPYWAISRIFTPAEAEALLPRVRAGDIQAKQEMVMGYMRLALTISGLYYAKLKSKRWVNELVDAAMMGVVEGVDRLHRVGESEQTNPKSLVADYIHFNIAKMFDDAKFIRIDQNTQNVREYRGQARLPEFTQVSDPETNDCILYTKASPDTELIEVENLIDTIIETEMEAKIVSLRREGYKDDEIGSALGVSQQAVQVIRQDLHDRISVLLPERKARNGKAKETTDTKGVGDVGAGPYRTTP